ncbi:1950_t:CDS:2, partial [Funneliformis geosporum]
PIIKVLNDGDNGKIQKPASIAKRGRKKKEPIIEALNNGNNGKIQEIMVSINQKENNKVYVSELLETSDGYLSEDVINIKHKPLALITNNIHINKLHNNSLNNSNEATDRTLNYNSHLINTPCYTTPYLSSRSTNTCLSTTISRSPCSTDTCSSMAHNVLLSTSRTSRSTNTRSFISHSNNTNFNDNIFRSNTSNVFYLNTSLNNNTVICLIFDAFNDDEFCSNNTSF